MDNRMNEIYSRQDDIIDSDLKGTAAIVIGLGGIGSWVAMDLALLGIGTLILIDPDTIEPSNLNRTIFKLSDINRKKTDAIVDLIAERRQDALVIAINDYFAPDMLERYPVDFIFDCTDSLSVRSSIDPANLIANYVKCGYDGFSATISINDFISGSWGDGGSYTIVSSYFGTPQVISALVVTELILNTGIEPKTLTFEVNKMLESISERMVPNEEVIDQQ